MNKIKFYKWQETKKYLLYFLFLVLLAGLSVSGYFYRNFFFGRGKAKKEIIQEQKKEEFATKKPIKVPIFVYHRVTYEKPLNPLKLFFFVRPDVFEKQIRYLKENGFVTITFDDLLNHFYKNTVLPDKAVILSFDDGTEDHYKNVFPVLQKNNFVGTFFVPSDFVSQRKNYLTWDEVKEMSQAGMDIEDHSETHPLLFTITEKDKLIPEILESKKTLEDHLGKKIDIFAYPFGKYNVEIIKVLQEAGFKAARTAGFRGVEHRPEDFYTLKTVDATNDLKSIIRGLELVATSTQK